MNANELADLIERCNDCGYNQDAANMLRQFDLAESIIKQQQLEIEALKGLIEVMRMGQPNIDYDKELLKPTFVGCELTDEVIEQVRVAIMGIAYWCADENMPEAYNAVKVCCGQVLGILDKAQEK